MPVSSPSYFPPNRSNGTVVGLNAGTNTTGARNFLAGQSAGQYTDINDLIIIGNLALSAGTSTNHIADANLGGVIVIGNGAAASLTQATGGPSSVILGYQAAATAATLGSSVVIGYQAYANAPARVSAPVFDNVIVGSQCAQFLDFNTNSRSIRNVIVGTQAMQGSAVGTSISTSNVVIGWQCVQNNTGTGSISSCVVIGPSAAQALGSSNTVSTANVIIGDSTCPNLNSADNTVCVGHAITLPNTSTRNTVIGANAFAGLSGNVLIGDSAICSTTAVTGAILIGAGAGLIAPSTSVSSTLTIESYPTGVGPPIGALVYGQFNTGNIILGNSVTAQRDLAVLGGFGATNILRLLNGAPAVGANPNGGYLYINAGSLRYVGSNGTETEIAPP